MQASVEEATAALLSPGKRKEAQVRMQEESEGRYVMDFGEIDHTHVAVVGGKGAVLGELSRVKGIRGSMIFAALCADAKGARPRRACVTTSAIFAKW